MTISLFAIFFLQINNIPVETLSYADARKLIQASKDKLMLEICRNRDNALGLPPHISQNNLGAAAAFDSPMSTRNQPPDPMQDIFAPTAMPDDEPIVAIQSPPQMAAPQRPPLPSDGSYNDYGKDRIAGPEWKWLLHKTYMVSLYLVKERGVS